MEWWKQKNGILQIYPRSFKDSNRDGVGDLRGITQMLPYVKGADDSLGVDAIWLSPFYTSPMADFGYDVADYCGVDPLFGTLEDFKTLVMTAHAHDVAVIIDLVPNHTSNQHVWFREAVAEPTSDKRDYYLFRDGVDGKAPNNWLSVFGGSAWQYDEQSGQYYLHSFLKEQPDLNWSNPAVQEEFRRIIQFWCDLGVDGFRLDAINWLGKSLELTNEPNNVTFQPGSDPYNELLHVHSQATPELDEYLHVMTSEIKKYPGKIMLFESYTDDSSPEEIQLRRLYDIDPDVAAPFHFGGIAAGSNARATAKTVHEGLKACPAHSALIYCLGNHDKPRLISRVGAPAARALATIQLTLPGIPVIYYGEELGMSNAVIDARLVLDPYEKQVPGKGLGRDAARTPMQWSNAKNSGFTDADTTWLPVGGDYHNVNVTSERHDPNSFLALYKKLFRLRSGYKTLRTGKYTEIYVNDELYIFTLSGNESFLVIANLSDSQQTINLPENGLVICSARQPGMGEASTKSLQQLEPWDVFVVKYDFDLSKKLPLFHFFR